MHKIVLNIFIYIFTLFLISETKASRIVATLSTICPIASRTQIENDMANDVLSERMRMRLIIGRLHKGSQQLQDILVSK